LMQEMGIQCKLEPVFQFKYRTEFENGLIEHEWDHVFTGQTDELPIINPNEVMDWKYLSPDILQKEIHKRPDHFTSWMKIIFEKVNAGK
jgi:isopentenyl-diphosphate Delta-isomerase